VTAREFINDATERPNNKTKANDNNVLSEKENIQVKRSS
jgi:hypothetical protein